MKYGAGIIQKRRQTIFDKIEQTISHIYFSRPENWPTYKSKMCVCKFVWGLEISSSVDSRKKILLIEVTLIL